MLPQFYTKAELSKPICYLGFVGCNNCGRGYDIDPQFLELNVLTQTFKLMLKEVNAGDRFFDTPKLTLFYKHPQYERFMFFILNS